MLAQMMNVNWLAILACGVALMLVGFIWYTVFAAPWAAFTGWTREKVAKVPQAQLMTSYLITFLTALVMAFVLANVLKLFQAADLGTALLAAFMVWLGFTAAPTISNFAFERRPWGLWALIFGNTLVGLFVCAVILSLWR